MFFFLINFTWHLYTTIRTMAISMKENGPMGKLLTRMFNGNVIEQRESDGFKWYRDGQSRWEENEKLQSV